ncbi:MAG: SAM-dependent chlorinase/fluorinase, partial [Gammaproteobacteria bacterium]|nr:SAM-dependent chlorinase/fluorinase [Gammaproteobacteria bacterium]
ACAAQPGTIFFAVVDPGVGSFRDTPVVIKADGQWYVGPDNGLFDIVCQRSSGVQCWRIDWRPETLSASFHGRDLYAPAAAMIRKNEIPGEAMTWEDRHGWPDDLEEIVYIDHFGNCMTGTRAEMLDNANEIQVGSITIPFAHTFSSVPSGDAFWYRNSQGLIEIAVNGGSAAEQLKLEIGTETCIPASVE